MLRQRAGGQRALSGGCSQRATPLAARDVCQVGQVVAGNRGSSEGGVQCEQEPGSEDGEQSPRQRAHGIPRLNAPAGRGTGGRRSTCPG
eukprot:5880570-Prymnesium_polylepis.1